METFQCTSIGIGRSAFVVVDGAEYRKQEPRRRGMLRSDWVDKCENNQRHLYPPLPSILWCGFQTMMTAINKGDQEDKAMTEATIIDKNNHGLAVCLCWSPQSVCLRPQSVQNLQSVKTSRRGEFRILQVAVFPVLKDPEHWRVIICRWQNNTRE